MASFMITGGKVGRLLGRKRAFAIGCVIYGAGSMTTTLSPNLAVLLIGWSLLEGIGAALIMPAIVALVASNFDRAERPRAYGIVAACGVIAVAVGPVTWPLLLAGLGIGALASQLGSVTVSSVPDEESADVGGIQNSFMFLGSSIGTALAGAVLISALSTSFLTGIEENPDVPKAVSAQAQVQLGGGVPFISDASCRTP